MFKQKRIVVRVFLPGPPEKVTDWARIVDWMAAALESHIGEDEAKRLVHDLKQSCVTERPSRADTGVDLVIANSPQTGMLRVTFANNYTVLEVNDPSDHDPVEWPEFFALGFPTEPEEPETIHGTGQCDDQAKAEVGG